MKELSQVKKHVGISEKKKSAAKGKRGIFAAAPWLSSCNLPRKVQKHY